MIDVHIGFPNEEDWDWIIERHAETAWASLAPEIRHFITIQMVRDSLAEQTSKFCTEHGATNQVFIARTHDSKNMGYVWVGQVKSAFTGVMQAHVLNIYVESEIRGQGIGARLLAQAETWARQNDVERISLSVAVENKSAVALYESIDYRAETLRMVKNL